MRDESVDEMVLVSSSHSTVPAISTPVSTASAHHAWSQSHHVPANLNLEQRLVDEHALARSLAHIRPANGHRTLPPINANLPTNAFSSSQQAGNCLGRHAR